MRDAAIVYLDRWAREADDPDPEQREWKLTHGEGAILAYERLGVLEPEEAASWRAQLNGNKADGEPALPADARAAAMNHLAEIVDAAPRLRRRPSRDDLRRGAECSAAIEALHAIGALTSDERAEWHRRLLATQAPWIDDLDGLPTPGEGFAIAVNVPPETEEEAEEDWRREAEWASRPEGGHVTRVIGGSIERHAGIAIVAAVVHEDATSLHFHFVGDPVAVAADDPLESFHADLDALTPPALSDDAGTAYHAIGNRPDSASGTGGPPGTHRRRVITGSWLYTPPVPPGARRLEARLGAESWRLS